MSLLKQAKGMLGRVFGGDAGSGPVQERVLGQPVLEEDSAAQYERARAELRAAVAETVEVLNEAARSMNASASVFDRITETLDRRNEELRQALHLEQ